MPTPTFTPGDKKQDEKLNPGQQDYDRRFNDIAAAEEKGTFDDIAANYDKTADSSQEDKNIDALRNKESEGDWKNNVEPQTEKKNGRINFKMTKKKGGLLALIASLGVGGGLLAGLLGPFSMPISLMENLTATNDSSSTAMERRFMKIFGFSTKESDPVCKNSTKNIKCRMGRISNKALTQLKKKGVVAYFDNDATGADKKTGYPSKNPKGYTIDTGGGKTVNISAADLPGYLADNPRIAAKVLGAGGAFNLKLKAWSGKYITKKFFNAFGIKKDGGLADGENKRLSASERLKESLAKMRERIPGLDKVSNVAEGVQKKVEGHLGKAKKGGVGYTLAVAGCIAVKAPGYIAAGVAAVQLAQLLPLVSDTILSPGSKIKASGVDVTNAATMEDAETVGTILTARSPRESDGKMTSALDSPSLQAALGVNKNKVPISNFAPGYAVLTSPVVIAANKADKASQPACNAIMSPAAMYTALAVDAAVTVAASATVIGGIVKVIASLAISEIAAEVVKQVAGETAKQVLVDVAQNDALPTAEGEALGDALGVSGAAFFSAGGMAHNLPTLKMSQVSEFAALQQESQDFQRDMDIASLSPFDISSRYTFLGSIAYDMNMAAIQKGTYNTGILSSILNFAQLPLSTLSSNAGATTNFNANYCDYASEYGLETEDEADTPAITMSGLPCTGITGSQASMSSEEAISLIQNEGWLDESKSIDDDSTITDLVSSGYIKGDTPLADFIETCSDPSTGDYIFNSAGCTVNSNKANTDDITNKSGSCFISPDGEEYCASDTTDYSGTDSEGVSNPRALEAISTFLLDYQIVQSINGEDDESAAPSAVAGASIDMDNLYEDSTGVACATNTLDKGTNTGYVNGRAFNIRLCALPNSDEPSKPDGMALVNSRVSGAVYAMLEQMKKDIKVDKIPFVDSYRSPEEQQSAINRCGLYSNGGCAAAQGYSNHQSGVALDFEYNNKYCVHSRGILTCPASPYWTWLNEHAKDFGYKNTVDEWWHWSPTGG